MFRSNVFNLTKRRKSLKDRDLIEMTILHDFPISERRTFAHSPAFLQVSSANMENHRLLGIGRVPWERYIHFQTSSWILIVSLLHNFFILNDIDPRT